MAVVLGAPLPVLEENELNQGVGETTTTVVLNEVDLECAATIFGLVQPAATKMAFCCQTCGNGFHDRSTLMQHIRQQHYTTLSKTVAVNPAPLPAASSSVAAALQCRRCPLLTFENRSTMAKHLWQAHHHPQEKTAPFSSVECVDGITFHDFATWQACLVFSKPAVLKTFVETTPNNNTDKLPALMLAAPPKRVLAGKTRAAPLECPDCGRLCHGKYALTVHRRVHSGEQPYACEVCHVQFSQLCNAKKHRALHKP